MTWGLQEAYSLVLWLIRRAGGHIRGHPHVWELQPGAGRDMHVQTHQEAPKISCTHWENCSKGCCEAKGGKCMGKHTREHTTGSNHTYALVNRCLSFCLAACFPAQRVWMIQQARLRAPVKACCEQNSK
eukprot:scaffold191304_cov14-Tisochrysis_lutea.AAC.1